MNVQAQRIYASMQQSNGNISGAANALTSDPLTYATLTSVLFGSATQNLQFSSTNKPTGTTPIILRITTSTGSVLGTGLLSNLEVAKTSGGINTTVGTIYTNNTLAAILGLGSGVAGEMMIPPENANFDGVRAYFYGLANSIRIYYAFYIKSPAANHLVTCSGQSASLLITNFQSGYTYKLYEGNTEVATSTTANMPLPVITTTTTVVKNYSLEAIEASIYPSGRTAVQVTIRPNPSVPNSATLN
ncbi:MAG: hypothetical protein EOP54_06320 [Sphingobacteriales bacterium]|nr:MAG: hypothetical protein EOP54_06320 [Sphingobacteriales bacterium]